MTCEHRSRAPLAFSWVVGLLLMTTAGAAVELRMPWKEAGLTKRQAAVHLLNRFAFGPRPQQIDEVLESGLEAWFERQLAADSPDEALASKLEGLDVLGMSGEEIEETFPPPPVVLRRAIARGLYDDPRQEGGEPQNPNRQMFSKLYEELDLRPPFELMGQLMAQKIWRALESENQLQEVMTDFWFNHFNVSLTDNQARTYILSYERDAIRPHVLGDFGDLLLATASHPAMLHYLDNAQSRAEEGRRVAFEPPQRFGNGRGRSLRGRRAQRSDRPLDAERPTGLNENYARELLELHTLGVDGGYTQQDVIEVARAFTGWTVVPPRGLRERQFERQVEQALRFRVGLVRDGSFLFHPGFHDAEEKVVLGKKMPSGRGVEDGREVLRRLEQHPSTARFISEKLAIRFVADGPPASLVDSMARTFRASGGDISAVLRTLVESPEFWAQEARDQKIKSPFELAVSAVRAVDGEVFHPGGLAQWISRMGQPLYAYQAPTGYPDRAEAWVNSGALLNRMNFGLQLAAGQIPGMRLDLPGLNDNREPESIEVALLTYAELLLPERELTESLARLVPLARDRGHAARVDELAKPLAEDPSEAFSGMEPGISSGRFGSERRARGRGFGSRRGLDRGFTRRMPEPDTSAVANVVGVLLGSPGFQRR